MNNELLKRIDDLVNRDYSELENTATWVFTELLDECHAEIERLSKPYVPMTDDEIIEIADTAESNAFRMSSIVQETGYEGYRAIETAVIKRLGLEIKHD